MAQPQQQENIQTQFVNSSNDDLIPNFDNIYKKYEQLSIKIDERIKKINKKIKKTGQ